MRTPRLLVLVTLVLLVGASGGARAAAHSGNVAARFVFRATRTKATQKNEHGPSGQRGGASSARARELGSQPRLEEAQRLEAERDRVFSTRVSVSPSLRKLFAGVHRSATYAEAIEALRGAQLERMSEAGFQSWSRFEAQRDRVVARLRAPIARKAPSALHDGMLALITEYLKYAGQPRYSENMAQLDYADFLPMMSKLLASGEAASAAPADKAATKLLLQRFYLALVEYRREGGTVEHWNGSVGMDLSRLAYHDALR